MPAPTTSEPVTPPPCLKLWPWAEAPEAYKVLSLAAGDEDLVLFCPSALVREAPWPPLLSWLGYLLPEGVPAWQYGWGTIQRHAVADGVVLIFSHS